MVRHALRESQSQAYFAHVPAGVTLCTADEGFNMFRMAGPTYLRFREGFAWPLLAHVSTQENVLLLKQAG